MAGLPYQALRAVLTQEAAADTAWVIASRTHITSWCSRPATRTTNSKSGCGPRSPQPFPIELLLGGSFGQKAFAGIDPASVPSSASASGRGLQWRRDTRPQSSLTLGAFVKSRALYDRVAFGGLSGDWVDGPALHGTGRDQMDQTTTLPR